MKHAIIAIEDRRFYTNEGVDLRGIGRALLPGRRPEGGRPGRLDDHAAVRQERARRPGRPHALPEAPRGRARVPPHAQVVQGEDPPQLPEHDLLRQRRLRHRGGRADLLRPNHPGCGERRRQRRARRAAAAARRRCSPAWSPSPSAYDPIAHPRRRRRRRNVVLQRMFEQGFLTQPQYEDGAAPSRCPTRGDLQPPERGHEVPVLHVLDQAAGRRPARRRPGGRAPAFEGGLRVQTTIDSRAAGRRRRRRSTSGCPYPDGPRASLVAIENQHRQGPRDGRRRRLQRRPVQPRHPGPAPARLGDQAVHPRRGADARASRPNSIWASHKLDDQRPAARSEKLHRQQLRGRLRRRDDARAAR